MMSKNKMTRNNARKGKTARKQYRRLTTGSYNGQRKEYPKTITLHPTVDGHIDWEMRLTHVTQHRFTDSTVRHKAHYLECFEEEYEHEFIDKEGEVQTRTSTRKVDGDHIYSTYSTAVTQEA